MAAKETLVQKLHRLLHDKTCLCHMNEASVLDKISSLACWIREVPGADDGGASDTSRCVNEQARTADEASLEDSVRKDECDEYPASRVIGGDASLSNTLLGCPADEGTTRETYGQKSQDCKPHDEHSLQGETGGDSVQQDVNYRLDQRRQEDENRKQLENGVRLSVTPDPVQQSPLHKTRCHQEQPEEEVGCKQVGNKLSAKQEQSWVDNVSRDGMLLCLTVGKELFEARHCERVHHLQLEMVGRGSLLEELGRLMTSNDRLVAFMTCKMARAVLLSAALDKDQVASFLQHHLHRSLSTVVACRQNPCQVNTTGQPQMADPKQDQVDREHVRSEDVGHDQSINPGHYHGQVNQGQVNQGQTNHDPVDQGNTNHSQINHNRVNPGQTKQGLDNLSQANQAHVNSGQDNLYQVYDNHVSQGHRTNPSWDRKGLLITGQDDAGRNKVNSRSYANPDQVNPRKSKPGHLNPSKVNPGQANHAVFTFDLCRLLLKKVGDEESQQLKEECDGTEGSQTCTRNSQLLAAERCERLKNLQTELAHLLNRNLPDMLQAFPHPASAKESEAHRMTGVNADVDGDDHTGTLLLASFLDLVHALLKHGNADQHWQSFTAKLAIPLMTLLRECCSDLIVLKKILDIFVLLTNQSAATRTHSSQSHSSDHPRAVLDEHLVAMAMVFVNMVVKGNFFECIPYRDGPVGFGGGHFCSRGFDDEDEDLELGDRPLLRKLCRATLSAMKILLHNEDSKSNLIEAGVEKCLQILSKYICQKLDVDTWLFELFADQDDSLVWAMHCCLDLHKAVESLWPPCGLSAIHFNPHRIFVRFLDTVAHDPSVLLDLLISSETPFLEYLVQYLHAVIRDWDSFCRSHHEITFKDSKTNSKQFPIDVPSEESSDNEFTAVDENVGSSKVSVEDKPYLASKESSQSHRECEEALGEHSPRSKRRKTELRGDINPETRRDINPEGRSLQEPSNCSASRKDPAPTRADESEEDLLTDRSCTDIKSAVTNYPSLNILEDLTSSSDEISSRLKRRKTKMQGGKNPECRSLQGPGSYGTSAEAPTGTQPDKSGNGVSRRFTDADRSLDSSNSYGAQNAEVSSDQTNVSRSLEDVMTTLIRLRFLIERISGSNLFPYPVTPLLRLLERMEGMYEGMG